MALKNELDKVEMLVMSGIKHSQTLGNFLETVEHLAEEFDDELCDTIEEEKNLIDDKLREDKYAYLTIKNQKYKKITEKFSSVNTKAEEAIEKVLSMQGDIVR